jgi:hypothetical protein
MTRDRRQAGYRAFRQGKRAGDRWGPCAVCTAPTSYRCDRCERWTCNGDWNWSRAMAGHPLRNAGTHGRLRKLPGTVGRWQWVCIPRCGVRK